MSRRKKTFAEMNNSLAQSFSLRGKIVRDMDFDLVADGITADSSSPPSAMDGAREVAMRWFVELSEPLRRYLLVTGASPAQADDAIQETFLRLCVHVRDRGNLSNVRGWVFQVARNYLRDERKSAHCRLTISLDDSSDSVSRLPDSREGPDRAVFEEERFSRFLTAMKKLSAQERECITLRSAGLRYREIAEVMRISLATVSGLVLRATARLQKELL